VNFGFAEALLHLSVSLACAEALLYFAEASLAANLANIF
jgi:hypothetical protein